MSFVISNVERFEVNSKEANDYLTNNICTVLPTEEFMNELPLPKDTKIRPFYGFTGACKFLNAVLDFQTRADDVFVCSTPKAGTSWVHSIVWLLKHNLDYETMQTVDRNQLLASFNSSNGLEGRVEQLMAEASLDHDVAKKAAWNEHFNNFESPRVIKTFYPVYFLPKSVWPNQNKLIYVVRNPKDAAVSEYHFLGAFNLNLSIDDIVHGVTSDVWMMTPRSDHILNFWRIKHWPNVLFVAYEDLVIEPLATIKQMSEFLECNYTDGQLSELTQFISFNNMKNIATVNRERWLKQVENDLGKERPDPTFRFMRKGKVGSYRDELNESQSKKLDDWIKQMESESDFRFKL